MGQARVRLIWVILFLFFLTLTAYASAYPQTPMTRGSLCSVTDPDFETYRYESQIPYCKRNVSTSRKASIYDRYGIPKDERRNYTIDHLVPLSVGGSNHDDNLWPEHKEIKRCRSNAEVALFKQVRDGILSQQEAVNFILDLKLNRICL